MKMTNAKKQIFLAGTLYLTVFTSSTFANEAINQIGNENIVNISEAVNIPSSNKVSGEDELIKQLNEKAVSDNGFKGTIINRVDEKMERLTKLIEENALKEQLNRENMQSQQNTYQGSSEQVALPVVVGTTIISKKRINSNRERILNKEAMVVDSEGNKFTLSENNNSIIKTINNDYIDFNESDKKIPILVANGDIEKSSFGVASTMPITNIDERMKTVPKEDVAVPSLKESVVNELSK